MKVNRHSPKHLMVRFDFLEAASKLWHMFLLLLFYVDVAPAKTQAEDTDSALQSGLRPPHHLCQTGEQKVCSCVLCLQFLTEVCNLRSQRNDRVCPAHTHTHTLAEAGQEMGRDSVLITWCLSKHQIILPSASFFWQYCFLYAEDGQ